MVEYVAGTPNLNYVDKRRIGAAGYTAGGNAVLQSASLFGAVKPPRAARKAPAKDSVTSDMMGLRVSAAELGRTFLLALAVAAAFYVLLLAAYGVFHIDFRFRFVSA